MFLIISSNCFCNLRIEAAANYEVVILTLILPKAEEAKQRMLKICLGDTVSAIEIKVGEKVLYSQYAGTGMKLDYGDYVLLSQRDILATVKRSLSFASMQVLNRTLISNFIAGIKGVILRWQSNFVLIRMLVAL